MKLAVDANRDGVIGPAGHESTDETSIKNPYRFWVNDDADEGDVSGLTDFSDATNPKANFRDNTINGARDLVDFFRFFWTCGK
jgi:hypothetical protein